MQQLVSVDGKLCCRGKRISPDEVCEGDLICAPEGAYQVQSGRKVLVQQQRCRRGACPEPDGAFSRRTLR
jgi:hypothetical protein